MQAWCASYAPWPRGKHNIKCACHRGLEEKQLCQLVDTLESRQLVSHSARPPSGLSQLLCARRGHPWHPRRAAGEGLANALTRGRGAPGRCVRIACGAHDVPIACAAHRACGACAHPRGRAARCAARPRAGAGARAAASPAHISGTRAARARCCRPPPPGRGGPRWPARLLLLQVLLVAVGVVHHVEERALPRLRVGGQPLGDLARARADGREDAQHRLPHPLVAALEPAVALVDGHLGHHRAAQDRLQLLEGTLEPRLARLPTAWGGARGVACRAGRRLSASRPWCVLWVRAVVKGM